jgi:hypothetical protein
MYKHRGKSKGVAVHKSLEWEKFDLQKHVTRRLLNLCTISVVFVICAVGLLLYRGIDLQPTLLWGIIGGAVAIIGKIIRILMKLSKE